MLHWFTCCFGQSVKDNSKILKFDESVSGSSIWRSSSNSNQNESSSFTSTEKTSSLYSLSEHLDADFHAKLSKLLIVPISTRLNLSSDKENLLNQPCTSSQYGSFGYSSKPDSILAKPEINFDITYNKFTEVMNVFINYCRNLPIVDYQRQSSNPYVQIYLLPDANKMEKRRTQIKWNTINPTFDEKISPSFQVNFEELDQCKLWLTVWHSNSKSAWIKTVKNTFIRPKKICLGEVTVPLNFNKVSLMHNLNYVLEEPKSCADLEESIPLTKGVISLKIKFVHYKEKPAFKEKTKLDCKGQASVFSKSKIGPIGLGSLNIKLCHARDLPLRSNGKPPRPYCKCYLISLNENGKPVESMKQKTLITNKTCNPSWNHILIYPNLRFTQLKDCCLEIHIWDYNNKFEKTFLGGVRLCSGFAKVQEHLNIDYNQIDDNEKEIWRQLIDNRESIWFGSVLKLNYFSPINRSLNSLSQNDDDRL